MSSQRHEISPIRGYAWWGINRCQLKREPFVGFHLNFWPFSIISFLFSANKSTAVRAWLRGLGEKQDKFFFCFIPPSLVPKLKILISEMVY